MIKTKNSSAYAEIVGMQYKKTGMYAAVVGCFEKVDGAYQSVLSPPLLRFASPYNRINGTSVTMGAGVQTATATCELLTTGSGAFKSLQLRFDNLAWDVSTIAGPGNAITILAAYMVCNGVSKQVTFGGATSITLANGQYEVLCDTVLPTDFGLTEFAPNTPVAARHEISCPVGGRIPFKGFSDTGNRGFWYDPTVTTVTNLSAASTAADLATTGTAPSGGSFKFGTACNLVGEFVTGDPRTIIRLGDSFRERGPNNSADLNAALRSPQIAGCQVGHSGSEVGLITSYPEISASFFKYANVVDEEFGTNSVNSNRSLAQMQADELSIWALIRASQSPHPRATAIKIFRPRLLARTSGTWTTVGGQTVIARWGRGELADKYWDWLQTQVGQPLGVTMAYDPWVGVGGTVRGSSNPADDDYYKFGANMSSDGTHIVTAAAVIGGANTRPAWDAVA